MLAVLTINGVKYTLGPIRDWARYLDGLQAALTRGLHLERSETWAAAVRPDGSCVYRIDLQPWPSEREALYG